MTIQIVQRLQAENDINLGLPPEFQRALNSAGRRFAFGPE
jgi:hypothetical protein